jgi:hypothetical protein
MVFRRSLTILLLVVLLTSCRSFDSTSPTTDPASELTPLPVTPTPEPDYVSQLRNAEYQLGFTDALTVVQLAEGKYETGTAGGADHITVTMTDYIVKGSFNGSGDTEYAVLVAESYGGSGTFVFLAVYEDVNGMPRFVTSRFVDDRPQINELSVSDANEIFLGAVIHDSEDPMCCPTKNTTRHFRMDRLGHLVMTDYLTFTPDGRPRTITIEAPASGTEVFNSVQLKGSVDITPFENTLTYRIVDVGGVELAIGAFTVTAAELGDPGTFDQTISLGNILTGAVIRIEVQDISAKDGSLFAMDSVELVVK